MEWLETRTIFFHAMHFIHKNILKFLFYYICCQIRNILVMIVLLNPLIVTVKLLEILKFILRCKDVGKNAKIIFLGSNQNTYGEKCREFSENRQESAL